MISWTDLLTKVSYRICTSGVDLYKGKRTPKVVVWNITSYCNLHCRHCYFDANQKSDPLELSHQEARDFIKDLAELGVAVILFSGGEPLLRKDIFELARFAKDNGVRPALSTNGTLITKGIARKIKDSGFSYVGISLDGIEKTHDLFRREKGAFKASLSAIRNCRKVSLKVGLRFTLTRYNLKDLSAIFSLVERESIPRLCIYHLVYSGRATSLKQNDLNHKERRKALELIWQKTFEFFQKSLDTEILTVDNHADGAWICLKLKEANPKAAYEAFEALKEQGGNSSGISIAAVDYRGNVYADQFLRNYPLGNIRFMKFSDIWRTGSNSFLQELRNRSSFLKGRCQRCNFMVICNGNFRARAEAVYGDVWAEDPCCYLTEEEISQKWN